MFEPSTQLQPDVGPGLKRPMIAFMVLPTAFVALRFWSRAVLSAPKKSGEFTSRLWWDDWACLLALVMLLGTNGMEIKVIGLGYGRHMATLRPSQIYKLIRLMWVVNFTWNTGTAAAKGSALFFYARIFRNSKPPFRYALRAMHGLNAAWFVGATLAIIFECRYWLGSGISNTISDVLILLIPIPILWRLQMKLVRKILVTAVFICGYGVVVVSVGRLIAIGKYGAGIEKDISYNTVIPIYWFLSEIPITVMSLSLPNIFALVKEGYRDGLFSILGSFGSSLFKHTHSTKRGSSSVQSRENARLSNTSSHKHPYSGNLGHYNVEANAGSSFTSLMRQENGDTRNENIYVRREFDVKWPSKTYSVV